MPIISDTGGMSEYQRFGILEGERAQKKHVKVWSICEKAVSLQPIYVGKARKSKRTRCFACRFNPKTIKNKMYVIAEIQGQQFKVEEGKKLYVHHMQNVETGATVEIEKVLLADNDGVVKVGTPTVEGAKVVLEVLVPLIKGDKVLVFHKRRRKGYRKLRGHREQFTQVLVKSVVA